MTSESANLTLHDKLVLEKIFHPNLPLDEHVQLEHEVLTGNCLISDKGNEKDLKWSKLQSEAMKLAEGEDFDTALELFNEAIKLQPDNAAGYNNRAQVLRLKGDVDGAKNDLELAIAKSGGVGSAACQAFTQRALIRRLQGDDEGCLADFKKADELGGKFAKQQLAALNPYAALCNQMVSQMMSKVAKGEATNSGDPAA
ncbi:tetratricopeptide repeat protein 36-like [Watersipora subatra]|uniref:tetratricopeptide repeat protein 36-like n=1 Tax=Watersipora subatra TaxID=2589382 RepID=UPI00355C4044